MSQHPSIQQLGQAIRARRLLLGWTQEEFAGRIELDRAYYSHIERGGINISVLVLFRIAAGLDCDPGELLPKKGELVALPPPSRTRGRRQVL